jgi:hypothetical protein
VVSVSQPSVEPVVSPRAIIEPQIERLPLPDGPAPSSYYLDGLALGYGYRQ